jgi:hypothetical protein
MKNFGTTATLNMGFLWNGRSKAEMDKYIKQDMARNLSVNIVEEAWLDEVTVQMKHSKETPWVAIDCIEYRADVWLLTQKEAAEYVELKVKFEKLKEAGII